MDFSAGDIVKTIVIADDHQIVREGTKKIVASIDNTSLSGEAENGLEAIAAVKNHRPDLLILDVAMPLASGVEVFGETRRWSPETKVVLFTGFTSVGLLSNWINTGIEGMLLKSCGPEQIRECLVTVLNGGNYIAAEIVDMLKNSEDMSELTQREREVMSLIVAGNSNAEIGEKLFISIKTVEKHRGSLMGKLGVRSVADLMVVAHKEGWLDEHKQL